MDTLRDVLDVAILELTTNQPHPMHRRARYLIAVPVLGTGGGGATDLTGHVLKSTLQVLHEYSTKLQKNVYVDYVLVCADPATYVQAQKLRFRELKRSNSLFDDHFLDQQLKQEAERLAKLATEKHLSLFLGAGVSVGSGLPTWIELLLLIEDEFTPNGHPDERTIGDQCGWNPLEMAEVLDTWSETRPDRHGRTIPIKHRVQSVLQTKSRNPGLLLYLILGLEPSSIVTQNYDQLIERAVNCQSINDKLTAASLTKNKLLSVIPYHPIKGASKWLLKMHGCVSQPDDIVLTQKDYDRYEAGRLRALSGLVQANLMTSHFLFCGFSMTDPNYLRILEEVRHALKPQTTTTKAQSTTRDT